MPVVFFAAVLAVAVTVLGCLCWLVLRLAGWRKHGRRTVGIALLAFLLLLPGFLLVGVPILLSWVLVHASTRPQDLKLQATPLDFGRPFQEVHFAARDGVDISGWFLRGDPQEPLILAGHGLFRNRQEILERSCRLNQAGLGIVLIDFRSHGLSQKSRVTLGYKERLDLLGARDFVSANHHSKGFVYFGVSMGAVAAILAAAEEPEGTVALIADSPYDSLQSTVDKHTQMFLDLPPFPFARVFTWNLARLDGFSAGSLDPVSAAARLANVPTLLLYGGADRRMPREVAERLYNALPAGPKDLVFFERADHGQAFDTDPDGYIATILGFLDTPAVSHTPTANAR